MLHPQHMPLDAEGYPSSPPWHYVLTLLAALIPPVSICCWRGGKGRAAVPALGIADARVPREPQPHREQAGAFLLRFSRRVHPDRRRLPWLATRIVLPARYRGMWWYFWIVNTALLVIVTFSSPRRIALSRC